MDPQAVIAALQNASTSSEFTIAVKDIPDGGKFYNEQFRDLILEKKHLIVESASADAVTGFLYFFSREESKNQLLRTLEIRDLIIKILAPKINAGEAFEQLGRLICGITFYDKPSAELYSTIESFKAILSCFHRITSGNGARWIVSAFDNILTFNPSSKKVLNDVPGVAEAFVALLLHATTDETLTRIVQALESVLEDNETAQRSLAYNEWKENTGKLDKITPEAKSLMCCLLKSSVRREMEQLRQENQNLKDRIDALQQLQRPKRDDVVVLPNSGDAKERRSYYYQVDYLSGKVLKYEVTPQPSTPTYYPASTSTAGTAAWFLFRQQQYRHNNPNLRCHPNYRWISSNNAPTSITRCPRFYFRCK